MAGHQRAFEEHLEDFRRSIGCVVHPNISTGQISRLRPGVVTSLSLNGFQPTPIDGSSKLAILIAQQVIILPNDHDIRQFHVAVTKYAYHLVGQDGQEILAYHFMPEVERGHAVEFPHLHIGVGLFGTSSSKVRNSLHKAHLPTGPVSLHSFIRALLTEFGVTARRQNWRTILERI